MTNEKIQKELENIIAAAQRNSLDLTAVLADLDEIKMSALMIQNHLSKTQDAKLGFPRSVPIGEDTGND